MSLSRFCDIYIYIFESFLLVAERYDKSINVNGVYGHRRV